MSRPFVNTSQFSPVIADGIPPEDSMYYMSFYKENIKYIKEGYTVGGVRITGDHYWFLNFWKIRGLNKKTGRKSIVAPKFLEMQYDYSHHLEFCRINGKNMIVLKRRQIGATEYHAALGGKEFSFYPGSQTVYVAGLEFYTSQLLNNTLRGLNDQFDNEFFKSRKPDQSDYFKASYDEYMLDSEGHKTKVTKGFLSEVYGITAKNNPQAVSSRCFGKGTEILMFNGTIKKIEDIRIGDLVMGPDGKKRRVFELHHGISELYELDQKYGDRMVVNKDHLLYIYHKPLERNKLGNGKYVYNNFNDPDTTALDDTHFLISTENYNNKSKTFKRYCYHEKADRIEFEGTFNEAYFVGLWLGDGSSDRSEVTTMDPEIVEYLYLLAFQYGMSVKIKEKKDNRASSYYLSSAKRYKVKGVKNQLHLLLEELGIFKNKHIPEAIKFSSVKNRLDFLAGLIDSDGTLSHSKYPHYSITNKHKYIADEIVYIARSLGFHATSQEGPSYDNKRKYCGLKYQVYISGDIWDIPCKIERKKFMESNLPKRRKALRKTSFEINPIGQGEYFGFSCDKDQLFLLSDFTIVHNSPSLIIFEEAGVFPGVRQAYSFVKPSLYAEGKKTGMAIIVGCVCAGTKVRTNDGRVIDVEDLKKEDGILGYNGESAIPQEINFLKDPQKKPCYRITTTSGNIIECSEDHPFLMTNRNLRHCRDGIAHRKLSMFEEAQNLKIGDQLAVIDKVPVFGKKEVKDARLIGLLIGDGNYSYHTELYAHEVEIKQYALDNYKVTSTPKKMCSDGVTCDRLSIHNFREVLRDHGIYGQSKDSKRLPLDINEWNEHSICELLGGYFDADGNVSWREGRNARVVLTSSVKPLLEQVKYLLRTLGIGSIISTEVRRGQKISDGQKDHVFRLYINRQSDVLLFSKKIKLLCKNKQGQLDKFSNIRLGSNTRNSDKSDFSMNLEIDDNGSYFKDKALSGLRFERVTNVEFIGERDVYNLNASETHTYLANDFITHNTGGVMGKGADELEYIYYHPAEYDALEFDMSEFDEDIEPGAQKVGYFIPDWQYWKIDENGNNLKEESLADLDKIREDLEGTDGYNEHIITMPRKPPDSFMLPTGGYFGKKIASQLNKRRSVVMTHKELMNKKRIGNLNWIKEGKTITGIEWEDDPFGNIQVYEHPMLVDTAGKVLKEEDGEYSTAKAGSVPEEVYYVGTDSYDKDDAKSSTSKGACIVRKGFYNAHETSGFFCAKVFMREEKAYEFYENTAKVSYYYNAVNLVEWSNILIFDYYHRKQYDFLLMQRPDIMISRWITNSTVNNQYGIDPSSKRNWIALLKQQLKEPGEIDKMLDLDLMRAFINYKIDPGYNCDLTIAAGLCMVQVNESYAMDEEEETAKVKKPIWGYKKNANGIMTFSKS